MSFQDSLPQAPEVGLSANPTRFEPSDGVKNSDMINLDEGKQMNKIKDGPSEPESKTAPRINQINFPADELNHQLEADLEHQKKLEPVMNHQPEMNGSLKPDEPQLV